jgi:cyclic pyranopterin phosphate synthase
MRPYFDLPALTLKGINDIVFYPESINQRLQEDIMKDSFGREINYLRISVTEGCNQRCVYCMPENAPPPRLSVLSDDEIVEVVTAAAGLGINKIRITGGEPLTRPGIVELVRRVAGVEGIKDLAMTTNGSFLSEMAGDLKKAGLNRVNISLDTLDAVKFRAITRCGEISDTLNGIDAAFEAGFSPIKINTVLMGGINDDEIYKLVELTRSCPLELRFIELMPIGDTIHFPESTFIPCSAVLDKVPQLIPAEGQSGGVARLYRLPDGKGRVGLISPLSDEFCGTCSRLRLTADGCLKPCLHSAEEIHLRGLHGTELTWALKLAIAHKPQRHCELSATERSNSKRDMNRIGG